MQREDKPFEQTVTHVGTFCSMPHDETQRALQGQETLHDFPLPNGPQKWHWPFYHLPPWTGFGNNNVPRQGGEDYYRIDILHVTENSSLIMPKNLAAGIFYIPAELGPLYILLVFVMFLLIFCVKLSALHMFVPKLSNIIGSYLHLYFTHPSQPQQPPSKTTAVITWHTWKQSYGQTLVKIYMDLQTSPYLDLNGKSLVIGLLLMTYGVGFQWRTWACSIAIADFFNSKNGKFLNAPYKLKRMIFFGWYHHIHDQTSSCQDKTSDVFTMWWVKVDNTWQL